MSCYLVQKMSCGPLTEIEYFRREPTGRPSSADKRRFTEDARRSFARLRDVPVTEVVPSRLLLVRQNAPGAKAIELE